MLGSQLRIEVNKKIKRAVRQQVDRLLPAVVEFKFQILLNTASTDRIASLEKLMARMIKNVATKVINRLVLDLQVSTENRGFGQVQALVDSRLPRLGSSCEYSPSVK